MIKYAAPLLVALIYVVSVRRQAQDGSELGRKAGHDLPSEFDDAVCVVWREHAERLAAGQAQGGQGA